MHFVLHHRLEMSQRGRSVLESRVSKGSEECWVVSRNYCLHECNTPIPNLTVLRSGNTEKKGPPPRVAVATPTHPSRIYLYRWPLVLQGMDGSREDLDTNRLCGVLVVGGNCNTKSTPLNIRSNPCGLDIGFLLSTNARRPDEGSELHYVIYSYPDLSTASTVFLLVNKRKVMLHVSRGSWSYRWKLSTYIAC